MGRRARKKFNRHHYFHPKRTYKKLGLPNRVMWIPIELHEAYNDFFKANCQGDAQARKCHDCYCMFMSICCYFKRIEEYGEVIV